MLITFQSLNYATNDDTVRVYSIDGCWLYKRGTYINFSLQHTNCQCKEVAFVCCTVDAQVILRLGMFRFGVLFILIAYGPIRSKSFSRQRYASFLI